MHRRVFLRSEGNVIDVAAPQVVSGSFVERSAEVVARFNRFYAAVAAAYYQRPDLRPEHLVNPLLDPLLEIDADHPITTPLSQLDAVLEPDGSIRVIEINSVGVCLVHMRGLFYLIRELCPGRLRGRRPPARRAVARHDRQGLPAVHQLAPGGSAGAAGHRRAHAIRLVPRGPPLVPGGVPARGLHYVFGGPEHLEVTDKEIWLRGTRIDVLWADFFYMAYQCARYQETRFPSKMPDFGQTPAQAAELLANRRFLDHLRTGRVVNISPGRCSSMRAIQASVPPPSRAAKQCAGRGTASRSQRGLQCAATSLVRLLR